MAFFFSHRVFWKVMFSGPSPSGNQASLNFDVATLGRRHQWAHYLTCRATRGRRLAVVGADEA